jgi:hypothetical protein
MQWQRRANQNYIASIFETPVYKMLHFRHLLLSVLTIIQNKEQVIIACICNTYAQWMYTHMEV